MSIFKDTWTENLLRSTRNPLVVNEEAPGERAMSSKDWDRLVFGPGEIMPGKRDPSLYWLYNWQNVPPIVPYKKEVTRLGVPESKPVDLLTPSERSFWESLWQRLRRAGRGFP